MSGPTICASDGCSFFYVNYGKSRSIYNAHSRSIRTENNPQLNSIVSILLPSGSRVRGRIRGGVRNRVRSTSSYIQQLQLKGQLSPQPLLPPGIGIEPYELFSLFIPEDLYRIILKHTNLYASPHQAGEDGSHTWKPTIPGDLKTFCVDLLYGNPEWIIYWCCRSLNNVVFKMALRMHFTNPV